MAAVSSRGRNRELQLQVPSKWKDTDPSDHEGTKPKLKNGAADRKVPVVYYLSKNGQLEHPHFMDVPLSSNNGLYLRDVINRLNLLRGKGMASLYSWSSKRSYKNGFVWHDLAENDFIYPAHGHEYVLKGSEILDPSINNASGTHRPCLEATPSFKHLKPAEIHKSTSSSSSEGADFPVIRRHKNQSWSSIDLNEYKVYKTESPSESTRKLATDASTQTDDKGRRRKSVKQEAEIQELRKEERGQEQEVNREEIEISPPSSDSSPGTLGSLMKADGRLILSAGSGNEVCLNQAVENYGRMKASSVLMQLISCGSRSFRDCGATAVKEQGLSLMGHYKGRLPRGEGNHVGTPKEISSFAGVRLEDKEYFSGSLIETKTKEEILAMKRSNSYNADRRSSQLELHLAEKEMEGVRTKCIPRKSKAMLTKKDNINLCVQNSSTDQVGSIRLEVQKVRNESMN